MVVPKPSGDMRKANEAIVRERHPIPTVDDILYQLNGSKVFSKMDPNGDFTRFSWNNSLELLPHS